MPAPKQRKMAVVGSRSVGKRAPSGIPVDESVNCLTTACSFPGHPHEG
jgi:hypothetical protein